VLDETMLGQYSAGGNTPPVPPAGTFSQTPTDGASC
jgi:hypothetical protein